MAEPNKENLPNAELNSYRNLRIAGTTGSLADAEQFYSQGDEQYWRSEYSEALTSWKAALSQYQEMGDRAGETTTLNKLGLVYEATGNYDESFGLSSTKFGDCS